MTVEASNTAASAAAATPAPAAPNVSAVPAAAPSPVTAAVASAIPEEQRRLLESPDTLKARLAEASEAATRKVFKDLGVKDAAEAQSKLAEFKKLQDAQLSDQERVTKQLAELQPKAERASALEQTVREYLAIEEGLVPEAKRSLLDLAPPAETPEARLKWIAQAKAKGLFTVDAVPAIASTTPAAPANTRAGVNPPPPPAPTNATKPTREMTPEEFKRYESQRIAEHTARR